MRLTWASVVLAVGLVFAPSLASAQTAGDPYANPPSGQEVTPPVAVGGVALVNTAPKAAQVAGRSQQALPVTGYDVAGLLAIGLALIAVGTVLRRNRPLARR